MNSNSFEHLGTISGLSSPRYIQIINPDKAYVSDLYSTRIQIINPSNYTITGSIETQHCTEQMVQWNDYVFVTCWSFGNQVLKIDTKTDQVVDSLLVSLQPNSLVIDRNNQLWVLSDGGFEGGSLEAEYPALIQIDPESFTRSQEFIFPSKSGSPNNLCINEDGRSLYFLYGSWSGESGFPSGVYQMSVEDTCLPAKPLIPENNRLFYRLGIDPANDEIYVSDALDFMQKGFVFRFDNEGAVIDSLLADRIPGYFAFL